MFVFQGSLSPGKCRSDPIGRRSVNFGATRECSAGRDARGRVQDCFCARRRKRERVKKIVVRLGTVGKQSGGLIRGCYFDVVTVGNDSRLLHSRILGHRHNRTSFLISPLTRLPLNSLPPSNLLSIPARLLPFLPRPLFVPIFPPHRIPRPSKDRHP